ncbi:MAG: PKD domain-containing protein, partial [Deltaproteobacteria bacterium]|nr:PKD domain-containing protein [Deltaproteobacteria bacterium]
MDDARDVRREPPSASGWGGRRISPIAPTAFALLLLASFACDTSGSSKSDLPDPFAAYSFEQVSGTLSVHFRNVSLKIDSSEWDFGDGSVLDATKSPVHTFSAAGVYEVKLTVTFPGGQSTRVRAVVVVPTPTISLVASPDFLRAGEMTTLIWSSANSISCVASGGNWSGAKNPAGGAEAVTVDSDTSYRLVCTGAGASGTASKSVDVAVELEIASASVRAGDQPKQLQ